LTKNTALLARFIFGPPCMYYRPIL